MYAFDVGVTGTKTFPWVNGQILIPVQSTFIYSKHGKNLSIFGRAFLP
jgi:hypothetical protein